MKKLFSTGSLKELPVNYKFLEKLPLSVYEDEKYTNERRIPIMRIGTDIFLRSGTDKPISKIIKPELNYNDE